MLFCSTLLLPITAPLTAYAETNGVREYHLQQDDLGRVLTRFAAESGVVLSFDAELTQGKASPGLNGRFSVEDGLRQLLTGSDLQVLRTDDGRYTLVPVMQPSDALELGATSITSNQLGTITEGTGSYTPGTIATATRLVLTPQETPQSISVITRQHMDDFALTSIDEVMRHTPGITVSTYDSERTNYYSRGFSIDNFQYDGIPTLRNSAYSAGHTLSDMALFDRVEVLKGAPGLLSGAGGPGGVINLIRKKPGHEFKGSLELGAGSWDNYRSQIDITGPLTEEGDVRGRAVAAYQDKHSFMDHYQRQTSVYYGILEFDLGPQTVLSVGADYQDNDPEGSGWSGSRPLFDSRGDRIELPRSYNNGAKWSSWRQYNYSLFSTLEHSFDNDWVGKLQYNHQINGYDAPLGSMQSSPNAVTGRARLYANKFIGKTTSDSLDGYVSGPFSLLGREHEVVLGGSARAHWLSKDYWNVTYYDNDIDFYNFDGDVPVPDWGPLGQRNDQVTRQSAIYLASRFSLSEPLSLLLGARLADYRLSGTDKSVETGRLVPYAGLVYDLDANYSLYASYTDIFMPQTYYRDTQNKLLEPDEGQNYEAGIKAEYLDGRLNASLAYFEVHQDNRPESDLDADTSVNPDPYLGIQAKTKGYEAEVSGELTPGWQLQAGFTHKIVRNEHGAKISTWEPQDQFNLYTTYRLTGSLDKLTVGGGARWQSESWQVLNNRAKGVREKFTQDTYWLLDVMARYQLTEQLSASLNVYNLQDKKYYTNIGFYNSAYSGDPRNVMLSTRWDF
ncbi:TonB-dependent siderophore receptor [Pseudomonas sp. PDM14]|uniref:TonB-dependent siderophore receptor n=1 Tax=Pseudomonas sp. PDM14 TaxID=2769288 RepID=UPI00399A0A11